MKEGSSQLSPIEQRIAESAAAASAAKAELDAAEAALKAFKAREAATEVPETAQAAPTDEDGYKTPNETEEVLAQAAPPSAMAQIQDNLPQPQHNDADTEGTAAQPEATETPAPVTEQKMLSLEDIRSEIAEVIGATPENDAPSPDIEPWICPGNIGTAACIATVIIGAVAMLASM